MSLSFFSFLFNDEQAWACYLIPRSISALVIKSVRCRIEKVLATLCRHTCENLTGCQICGCLRCVSVLKFCCTQIGFMAER